MVFTTHLQESFDHSSGVAGGYKIWMGHVPRLLCRAVVVTPEPDDGHQRWRCSQAEEGEPLMLTTDVLFNFTKETQQCHLNHMKEHVWYRKKITIVSKFYSKTNRFKKWDSGWNWNRNRMWWSKTELQLRTEFKHFSVSCLLKTGTKTQQSSEELKVILIA